MSTKQTLSSTVAAAAARCMARWAVAVAALLPLAAPAATFTVTTTADSGPGSLRQAIVDANAQLSGTHTIAFAIAGEGLHSIRPLSPLPKITVATTLDGYTQPGSSVNTLTTGSNAVLLIELDGSQAGANADGLAMGPNDCCNYVPPLIVRGLVINRFSGRGIAAAGRSGCDPNVNGCGTTLQVYGSRIGTDASGTTAAGNGIGIDIGVNALGYIGGAIPGVSEPSRPPVADRNLISGNLGAGVHIDAPGVNPSFAYTCYAHLYGGDIGSDASGTQPLGNGGNGVEVGEFGAVRLLYTRVFASDSNGVDITRSAALPNRYALTSVIGQSIVGGPGLGNRGHGLHFHGATGASVNATIQNNGGAGIRVEDEARVDFSGGVISDNGGLPIDLNTEGADANDALDADGGANEGVNWPVLTSASSLGSSANVRGSLDSLPNTRFEINFYQTQACDPQGHGQLQFRQTNKGSTQVTTDASGHADIDVSFNSGFDTSSYPYLTALTRFLSRPTSSQEAIVVSEVSQTCVLIAGAPSAGSVQLEQAAYSVSESGGSVNLVVTRSGGSSGAASVAVATADQTALAGSDYTSVSTTVTFADGDAAPRTVSIAITRDDAVEGDERFTVALSNASGAALGTPSSATVTITDDDTQAPPPTEPPPTEPPPTEPPPTNPPPPTTPVDGSLKAGAGALPPTLLLALGLVAALRRARRRLSGFALTLLAVATPAQAGGPVAVDEPLGWAGLYLGTQLGMGHFAQTPAGLSRSLVEAGHTAEVALDRSAFSGSLYLGVPVYPGLAIEAGVQDFGTYEGSLSGSSADAAALAQDAVEALDPAGRGVSLGIAHRSERGHWRFTGRVGGVYYRSTQKIRLDGIDAEDKDSGLGMGGGIGVGYRIGSRLSLGLTADAFTLGGDGSVTRLAVQLEYPIGRLGR